MSELGGALESPDQLGSQLFAEAMKGWELHLEEHPEEVGELIKLFELLRQEGRKIEEAQRRLFFPKPHEKVGWRNRAVSAFKAAAVSYLQATIREWGELADREHETFQDYIRDWIPACVDGLVFPNDRPACYWDARSFDLLHANLQRLAQEIGLTMSDREPPKHDKNPPSHLNRHERRAWHKINGKAAA